MLVIIGHNGAGFTNVLVSSQNVVSLSKPLCMRSCSINDSNMKLLDDLKGDLPTVACLLQ